MQPEPIDQWTINRIPLLVQLGRTEDPSTIPESALPNTWNFHFLWHRWDRVVENWDPVLIADLIKGLTHFEKVYSRGFGSVTPVAKVFGIYGSLVGANDRNDLAEWVLANTVNAYSPYGSEWDKVEGWIKQQGILALKINKLMLRAVAARAIP